MLHKSLSILLLLIAAVIPSFAQQIVISCSVRFEGRETAVSNASVLIEDLDDNKVLGFGYTSETGHVSISLTADKAQLQISVTGFNIERKTVLIEACSQDISLEVKYKEISLTGARIKTNPIEPAGDTTSYYVSMFADSLDRSIGDVLKKMPGLSVDKGGAIRYQGVLIDNFYIEGLDMMGSRYGVATNNIRAKDVATVEVYENHQPIKILRAARSSLEGKGRVAVNLKLRQRSKGAFIGSVQAGTGYRPVMWEGELVGMHFSDKYQTLITLKTNNSGRDIVTELKEQFDALEWLSSPFGVYSPRTPELEIERFMDNVTHAASMNNLFKIGKNKILSTNGIYIHDRQSFRDESLSKYYIPSSDPLTIAETTSKNKKTDHAEIRLKYTDNGDCHYIAESFSVGMQWDNSDGEVLSGQSLVSQGFKISANKSIRNHFDYSLLIGDNRWVGLKTELGYNDLPAEMSIKPVIFPEIFGYSQVGESSTIQSYSAKEFFASILPNFSIAFSPRWNFRAEAGAVYRFQSMKSSLGIEGMEAMTEDRFLNDNTYDRRDAKAGVGLTYRRNTLHFGIDIEMDYAILDRNDLVREEEDARGRFFFHPSLFFMYSFTPRLKMELLSYYSEDYAAFSHNYTGYIMTDYRRISNLDGNFTENRIHEIDFNLKYSNPLSGLFASSEGKYWGKWSNTIYGVTFIGNLSDVRSYSIGNISNGYSIEGKVSKYYDILSSTLDLSAGVTQYWRSVMRQEEMIGTDTWSPCLHFACVSNLRNQVKTRYNVDYSYSRTKYNGISDAVSIHALQQKLSVEYQLSPGVIVHLAGEHFYNSAVTTSARHIVFLDGSLLYRTKRCDLILEAKNLLNTREYSYSQTAEAVEFESAYLLRQRAVMLKVRFNIN